jgi:hypothetical protein
MTINDTFLKFRDHDNDKDVWIPVKDVIHSPFPITEELEPLSDDFYQWKDIGRGFEYVVIN